MADKDKSKDIDWALMFLAWLIAASGTLGSLFFSEVMDFAPCVLCWYQRIALYPLVVTLGIGLFPLEKAAVKYSLPIAVVSDDSAGLADRLR